MAMKRILLFTLISALFYTNIQASEENNETLDKFALVKKSIEDTQDYSKKHKIVKEVLREDDDKKYVCQFIKDQSLKLLVVDCGLEFMGFRYDDIKKCFRSEDNLWDTICSEILKLVPKEREEIGLGLEGFSDPENLLYKKDNEHQKRLHDLTLSILGSLIKESSISTRAKVKLLDQSEQTSKDQAPTKYGNRYCQDLELLLKQISQEIPTWIQSQETELNKMAKKWSLRLIEDHVLDATYNVSFIKNLLSSNNQSSRELALDCMSKLLLRRDFYKLGLLEFLNTHDKDVRSIIAKCNLDNPDTEFTFEFLNSQDPNEQNLGFEALMKGLSQFAYINMGDLPTKMRRKVEQLILERIREGSLFLTQEGLTQEGLTQIIKLITQVYGRSSISDDVKKIAVTLLESKTLAPIDTKILITHLVRIGNVEKYQDVILKKIDAFVKDSSIERVLKVSLISDLIYTDPWKKISMTFASDFLAKDSTISEANTHLSLVLLKSEDQKRRAQGKEYMVKFFEMPLKGYDYFTYESPADVITQLYGKGDETDALLTHYGILFLKNEEKIISDQQKCSIAGRLLYSKNQEAKDAGGKWILMYLKDHTITSINSINNPSYLVNHMLTSTISDVSNKGLECALELLKGGTLPPYEKRVILGGMLYSPNMKVHDTGLQLIREIFNAPEKHSVKEISAAVDAILKGELEEMGLSEEHPLVQQALSIGTVLERSDDPSNPFNLYKILKEKREAKVDFSKIESATETFNEIQFSVDPVFLKKLDVKLPTFGILPNVDDQQFKTLIENFEKRLQGNEKDELQKEVKDKSEYTWEDLLKESLGDNHFRYIYTLLGMTGKKEDAAPMLVGFAKCTVNYLLSLPTKREEKQLLSEQEDALLAYLTSIAGCKYGKDGTLFAYYNNSVPFSFKLQLLRSKETLVIESFLYTSIQKFILNMFSGQSYFMKKVAGGELEELVKEMSHQELYMKNLILNDVGVPHSLGFDFHSQLLYLPMLELSKEEALKAFYKFCIPHKLVEVVSFELLQELEKPKNVMYKTLLEYMGKEFEKFITVDETLREDGISLYSTRVMEEGVRTLLTKYGVLKIIK
jgi:hypothetical protein